MRTIVALAASIAVSACSSGLPDPVMLQGALIGGGQQQTGSIAQTERSVASRVLTAVAVERVTGQPVQNFQLIN
jgi:hypothetical protein